MVSVVFLLIHSLLWTQGDPTRYSMNDYANAYNRKAAAARISLFKNINPEERRPLILSHAFPAGAAFRNRIYQNSCIAFEFEWYMPGQPPPLMNNITVQCNVYDLSYRGELYDLACTDCFRGLNEDKCTACWDAPTMHKCNKAIRSAHLPGTDKLVMSNMELITHFNPDLPSVEGETRIYRSARNDSNCTDAYGNPAVILPSLAHDRELGLLTQQEIENLGIMCRIIETVTQRNGVQREHLSKPLAFRANDQHQTDVFQTLHVRGDQQSGTKQYKLLEQSTGYWEYLFGFHKELKAVESPSEAGKPIEQTLTYGIMPLLDVTQYGGVARIKDKLYLQSTSIDTEPLMDGIHDEFQTVYKVGCFNWAHDKWYAVVQGHGTCIHTPLLFSTKGKGCQEKTASQFHADSGAKKQFVAFHEGETGSQSWNEILWSRVFELDATETVVTMKCAQLGNQLVWSAIDAYGSIKIYGATLHPEYGTFTSEPIVMNLEWLCSCSSARKIDSTPAIDLLYPDLDNPNELSIAALCGQSICLSQLTGPGPVTNACNYECLSQFDAVSWFQIDQRHVYISTNTSQRVIRIKRNFDSNKDPDQPTLFKLTDPDQVKLTGNIIWFNLFKDQWKLPIPPHNCMMPKFSRNNVHVIMESNKTMKVAIYNTWNRSNECSVFGIPKLQIIILYAKIPEEQVHRETGPEIIGQIETLKLNFSQAELNPDSSLKLNEEIEIQNVIHDKWYQIEIIIILRNFSDYDHIQTLWYPGKPSTRISFPYFTNYPQLESQVNKTIIICSVIAILVLLILLAVAGFKVWKSRQIWNIPQSLNRLSQDDIDLKEEVGSGHFGEVRKAIWKKSSNNKVTVVVKILKLEALPQDQLAFREEALIVTKLKCDKIVKSIGICLQSRPIMLVFEYINGGSLDCYLVNEEHQNLLTSDDLLLLTTDALEACIYLAKEGYVHRDIAARNCLVVLTSAVNHKPKQLKLADFGLAKDTGHGMGSAYKSLNEQVLPINSSAPEALGVPSRSDSKSDVWSFGVLVYEMYSWGSVPFGACLLSNCSSTHSAQCSMRPVADLNVLCGQIVNEQYTLLKHPLPCVANFSQDLKEIMEICWKSNSSDRPSFNLLKDLISQKAVSIRAISLKAVSQHLPAGRVPSSVSVTLSQRYSDECNSRCSTPTSDRSSLAPLPLLSLPPRKTTKGCDPPSPFRLTDSCHQEAFAAPNMRQKSSSVDETAASFQSQKTRKLTTASEPATPFRLVDPYQLHEKCLPSDEATSNETPGRNKLEEPSASKDKYSMTVYNSTLV